MVNETLRSLGLNDKEIKIYLSLLPLGSSPASMLGKRTGITRSTAQYACQQLVKKGLISVIEKNGTFIYTPESPDKIIYLLEQQKKEIEAKEQQAHRIVGELGRMINPSASIPKVKFYEGISGIKDSYYHILNHAKESVYAYFSIVETIQPELQNFLDKEYTAKRSDNGIKSKNLTLKTKYTKELLKNSNDFLMELKMAPENIFPLVNAEINLYEDYMHCMFFDKVNAIAVVIRSEGMVKLQKAVFEIAWNSLK